jgi:hypothetical protein
MPMGKGSYEDGIIRMVMTPEDSSHAIYGYIIILTGTFFEGETVLIFAGFLAYHGCLELPFDYIVYFVWRFHQREEVDSEKNSNR